MNKKENEIFHTGFVKGYEEALKNLIGLTLTLKDELNHLIATTPKNKIIKKIKIITDLKMQTEEDKINEKTN